MKIEEDVDRLYQLPLGEFTPARNALAKELTGADATNVRKLAKPNIPAWAVNQLYWKHRPLYDRVLAAAEGLRTAHHAMIGGKSVDLHKTEAAHRDSVRAAANQIRQILSDAGETASPATMSAVNETLEALPPADEQPGRLTRPLKRMGFEALAGVVLAPPKLAGRSRPSEGGPGPPRPRERNLKLVPSQDKEPAPTAFAKATAAKKPERSAAKTREIDALEDEIRALRAEERQAQTALDHARKLLPRAEQDHARAQQELDEAAEKLKGVRADVARLEKSQQTTAASREKLEEKLSRLTED